MIPTRAGTAVGIGGGFKADSRTGDRSVLLLAGPALVVLIWSASYVNTAS